MSNCDGCCAPALLGGEDNSIRSQDADSHFAIHRSSISLPGQPIPSLPLRLRYRYRKPIMDNSNTVPKYHLLIETEELHPLPDRSRRNATSVEEDPSSLQSPLIQHATNRQPTQIQASGQGHRNPTTTTPPPPPPPSPPTRPQSHKTDPGLTECGRRRSHAHQPFQRRAVQNRQLDVPALQKPGLCILRAHDQPQAKRPVLFRLRADTLWCTFGG